MNDVMMRGITILQNDCHEAAREAGWWSEYDEMPEQYRKYFLAAKRDLMHTELSEATEGSRKNQMDDHLPHRKMEEVELADTIIRIMDYAGQLKYDLASAIVEKMQYNKSREDHEPENRAKDGGKSL